MDAIESKMQECNVSGKGSEIQASSKTQADVVDIAVVDRLPPLLRIPLEIRRLIFGYFLNINVLRAGVMHLEKLACDFTPLWICSSMREEAMDYFCKQNRWMQLAIYCDASEINLDSLRGFPPFSLPDDVLPTNFMRSLANNATLTIRLGQGCGRKKAPDSKPILRRIFAVTAESWLFFCKTLALEAPSRKYISFDLNPKYHGLHQALLTDFILPITMIRSLTRVRFTCLMHIPIFQRIAKVMTQSPRQSDEWHDYLKGLKEEADYAMTHGEERSAWAMYACGIIVASRVRAAFSALMLNGRAAPDEAALLSFGIVQSLGLDHCIGEARYRHALVQRTLVVDDYSLRYFTHLEKFHDSVETARKWSPGNDRQRLWIHYLTAKVYLYQATFLSKRHPGYTIPENAPEKEKDIFNMAAKEMFYAADLDTTRVTDAKILFDNIKAKLPSSEQPPLVTREIPGFGTWRGDPEFWVRFPYHGEEVFAAMAKQEPNVKTKEQLQETKKNFGIEWRDEPAGLLRLLV